MTKYSPVETSTTDRAGGAKHSPRKDANLPRVAVVIASTLLFGLTAWFAASTFSDRPGHQANYVLQSRLDLSFGSTVIILRVLQGLTSALTAVAVSQAYETVQWVLTSRREGLRLLSFLGLSPSTGLWGAAQLFLGRRLHFSDRAFAAMRLFLQGVLFVASIVLFIDTSSTTAYYTIKRFDVIAGTGPFDASMIEPYVASFESQVPFWALASTYNFITNSQFSVRSEPISCPERAHQCDSYLLPGGTYLMNALEPEDTTREALQSGDTTVVIHDAIGTQIEFSNGLGSGDEFLAQDCVTYGDDESLVGVYSCLAPSRITEGAIIAGIFQCPNGTQDGDCYIPNANPVLNVSTTMTVYNRKMTAVCNAGNNSISAVYDLAEPQILKDMNVTALQKGLGWNLDYDANQLPPMSSANFWFWFGSQDEFASSWKVSAYTSLQSLLAFIVWECCPNNHGHLGLTLDQVGSLPAEYHTTASLSESYTRFVLSSTMFTIYLVFECIPLVFCWCIVVWQLISTYSGHHTVSISSFPQVDFASKCTQRSSTGDVSLSHLSQSLPAEPSDVEIRHRLAEVVVTLGSRGSGRTADLTQPSPSNQQQLLQTGPIPAGPSLTGDLGSLLDSQNNESSVPHQSTHSSRPDPENSTLPVGNPEPGMPDSEERRYSWEEGSSANATYVAASSSSDIEMAQLMTR